jgi:hypothetical protein
VFAVWRGVCILAMAHLCARCPALLVISLAAVGCVGGACLLCSLRMLQAWISHASCAGIEPNCTALRDRESFVHGQAKNGGVSAAREDGQRSSSAAFVAARLTTAPE